MSNQLQEVIERLAKENPQLLEGLEKLSAAGLANDKMAIYNLLIKGNTTFTYEAIDKVLIRHENSRLDINWNKGDYIYRIVVSRRKREPEKPKKELTLPLGGGDNNGNNQSNTKTEGSVTV